MQWDQLERRLAEHGDDGDEHQVSSLFLQFATKRHASEILHQILEGRILPRTYASRNLFVGVGGSYHVRSHDLLNAPTSFAVAGFTMALDTAQRVEWLLEQRLGKRKAYLEHLLQTARAQVEADGTQDRARTEATIVGGPSGLDVGADEGRVRGRNRSEAGKEGGKGAKADEGGDDKDGDGDGEER